MDAEQVVHVVQIPTEVLISIVGLILGQGLAVLAIIWKGGRWTSRIEAELRTLNKSFQKHMKEDFLDLKTRMRTLEENCMRPK